MRQVISANYLDRDSTFPWLVRGEDEHPSKAVAVRNVVAQNVEFKRSSQYEDGFGCARVAVADSVEFSTDRLPVPKGSHDMTFHAGYYFRACDINHDSVKTLHLSGSRKMKAVLN